MISGFKDFFENTNQEIKKEAILERALSDKITNEVINQKVNAQINSINFGIKKINSRFSKKSKNYDIVEEQISQIIGKYEGALRQLGEFYDQKIEQLILRKMELQTNIVGSLVKQQYLLNSKKVKNNGKQNDKTKNLLKLGIKKAIEKIKQKKQKNNIDVAEINKLKDNKEIEKEHITKIENTIDRLNEKIKENKEWIEKSNKESYLISIEIKKINERKKQAILDAMETEEKWMITKIKKPKTFERITRFFSSRINTPKVIKKTLLDPFDEKIDLFIESELKSKK